MRQEPRDEAAIARVAQEDLQAVTRELRGAEVAGEPLGKHPRQRAEQRRVPETGERARSRHRSTGEQAQSQQHGGTARGQTGGCGPITVTCQPREGVWIFGSWWPSVPTCPVGAKAPLSLLSLASGSACERYHKGCLDTSFQARRSQGVFPTSFFPLFSSHR